MYQIIFSRTAEKDLDKVGKKDKPHIFAALFDLRKEPFLGKKLKGKFDDCYSLRVGSYRIIYKVYKKEVEILIIRIGQRQGVYK
ncbi:MAG: type II toxin-antitoxin system RelE/ParE family toxin [Candidatus Parcubacteria bacterium]|nr:type II toxin-antitoxin system RelE/ParE family toxin [Candidatus Parcubacteria bacterium]